MRKNPRGVHHEQWMHTQGCRRWFKAQRDTVSYEIQGYETFERPLLSMGSDANAQSQSQSQTQGKAGSNAQEGTAS
jgi:sarcosine oxidase subunit delta